MKQKQLSADYWIAQLTAAGIDPDAAVLSTSAIEHYNRAFGRRATGDDHTQRDLLAVVDPTELRRGLDERLTTMHGRLTKQQLLDAEGNPVPKALIARFDISLLPTTIAPDLRVTTDPVPIRCGPIDARLTELGADAAYDRNACSTTLAQEPIQLLSPWPGDLWLVRTRHSLGFVAKSAPLSPTIPDDIADTIVRGPRRRATDTATLRPANGTEITLPARTTIPLARDSHRDVVVATDKGFVTAPAPDTLAVTRRTLTRAALLRTAFEYLDLPYGFGGTGGGYDCSGLLLELFESFDLALPRHSGWQAQTGTFSVDVKSIDDTQRKLALLDDAQRHGVVLLHFPGHIMLYLGRADDGTPMALHALGEYATPCRDNTSASDTVNAVRRVVVSDLHVGAGSKRRSFLDRLERLVVFGAAPDATLSAVATLRQTPPPTLDNVVTCEGTTDARVFVSPQRPVAGQPLTVIATTSDDRRPARLHLFDPTGQVHALPRQRLGGPPYSEWGRVAAPVAGTWTAVIADGASVLSCRRVVVRPTVHADSEVIGDDRPVWQPRWAWERDTENLWSAFVEQLFDDPDPERTWTNLHTLLRDPARNLLHNHLGLSEDDKLEMVPDCADLPYSLRAYFAWKLSLPFAYRLCSRGRPGQPPTCGQQRSNLMSREADDDVTAFSIFVNRYVRSGVHSASGRTAPDDNATDLYPVALTARSLPVGTVYADPYGHVMMLSKWIPQGERGDDSYGILLATEAQPDGTIGRRRFWRGSFLFDPDTREVGAGFKQFRPVRYERTTRNLTFLTNAELARQSEFAPFSKAQYDGGLEGFYDAMDALINPRPLDPERLLMSLVDALQEAAERRVLSVDMGEQYMREHPGKLIPMPEGNSVFQTEGPWEDFSTPSRDMRLLIAIDTVLGVANRLKRAPERFGLSANDDVNAVLARVQQALDRELLRRTFRYRRSDGTEHRLSLRDVVDRARAFEVAYNPNDCPEVRWGAPDGSDEAATCTRRAPRAQRARLEQYRTWFRDRRRPAR